MGVPISPTDLMLLQITLVTVILISWVVISASLRMFYIDFVMYFYCIKCEGGKMIFLKVRIWTNVLAHPVGLYEILE